MPSRSKRESSLTCHRYLQMEPGGFMAFANKCLELKEKPFLSGGMKIKPVL